LGKGILNNASQDEFGDFPVKDFNLLSRIGDGDLASQEHFEIIPKTNDSNYAWQGGSGSEYYDFTQRQKIAERINKEE